MVPVVVWLPLDFPINQSVESLRRNSGRVGSWKLHNCFSSKDCQDNSSLADHGLSFPSRSAKATPLSCFSKETTLECVCTRCWFPKSASRDVADVQSFYGLTAVYSVQTPKCQEFVADFGGWGQKESGSIFGYLIPMATQ